MFANFTSAAGDRSADACGAGALAAMGAGVGAGLRALRLPFDAARVQYAHAVQAGLLPRSMLAAGAFEKQLGALECWTLGPLARRV